VNLVLVTNLLEVESNTPRSTSGVFRISMILGNRVMSGTTRTFPVFLARSTLAGDPLGMEVMAVDEVDFVILDRGEEGEIGPRLAWRRARGFDR
jgi:hypothetical protein